jgi:deazaflavin-dependent oxidoreductase (nitroreductase family)
MKSAGAAGSSASVVRHRGRTTGHPYETPVQAVPTEDGYVVALPYGTQADWLKNVLAAGSATVVTGGQTHQVEHPEVVPMAEVVGYFSPGDQRTHRIFGVDECLRVQRAAQADQA